MLYDENKDYSTYSDSELLSLIENAESDSQAYTAIMQEIQMRGLADQDPEYSYVRPEYELSEPPFPPAIALPYGVTGKLLWPLLTALVAAGVAVIFFTVLHALGSFQPKLYLLVAGVGLALVSQTFIITGVRDLINQKLVAFHKVCALPYIINAILWSAAICYGIYSAVRSMITFYHLGLGIAFYISIPALILATFAFFQATVFVLLSKSLKNKGAI